MRIDPECMDDSECDTNASCVDGFCECNPGFSGNGTICMEIITTPPSKDGVHTRIRYVHKHNYKHACT